MVPDPTPAPPEPYATAISRSELAYKLAVAADALALVAASDGSASDMRALAATALARVLSGWDAYPLLPGVLGDDDLATAFLDAATRP